MNTHTEALVLNKRHYFIVPHLSSPPKLLYSISKTTELPLAHH